MDISASQFRLLKMMDEIEDHAIILLDKEGNVESWNKGAYKIKGYLAQEIIGKNFRLFYPEADRQLGLPTRLLTEAFTTGKACHEGWRLRKDGSRFWGLITITAVHDENGTVVGFAKITRDLTERIQAENTIKKHVLELESQNKQLEHFVYIASHDLQEPLLNVNNFVELFQLEYAELFDETANMYLDVINQSTERMRNLIKGLLDYSRLDKEKCLSTVNCHQLIETLLKDLATTIALAGATIHYTDLPTITAYPIELRQLFQNLIGNAIKFRKVNTAPEIDISAEKCTSGWKFAVRDNGIGIDPLFKDQIFLIFRRLHERDRYEGNGIGLAYCKKIVEMHGGELMVESIPNKGSSFYFIIPDGHAQSL
ncbi:sensor histidine kinase [Spirosoma endophyticum]|uniref:histidine kinase n=1 Tax=Spirosoma endophyticum TaxID=662367 RepID=A0A1I2GNP7_9BACT|nr:ATP-binding protein [Spirosoma endophyticum]SFF18467.1 PAS domain S-box-containing protein [Spirosoma endophyticum]